MKPTLLVLAAGMGSRYGGLKQLDPMGPNGETIMDYSVFDALRAGFGKIVFVIRRDLEAEFRRCVGSRYEHAVEIEYAFQELDDLPDGFTVPDGRTKPWGTAQAVYAARNLIHEPFAVINADDFYGADGYRQLAKFLQNAGASEYAMCGFYLKNTLSEHGTVSRGVCEVDDNGLLLNVSELTKISRVPGGGIVNDSGDGQRQALAPDTVVSMNLWGFQIGIFAELERLFAEFLRDCGSELKSEFYIPFAVAGLVAEKRASVRVLTSADSWFGVTYQSDKPAVVSGIAGLIASGRYPAKLRG